MATDNQLLEQVVATIVDGHADRLTLEQVNALLEAYPYFTIPAATLCKSRREWSDPDEHARLLATVALSAPDPASLYMLIEPGNEAHAGFYPDEQPVTPTTESAIDTFLNTYGSTSPEEEALLNRLIFNPTPDYSQILAREEEQSLPSPGDAPSGSDDDRINRFILSQKEAAAPPSQPSPMPKETLQTRRTDESPTPPSDDSLLSESLARIFIKQKQYQRAFEIITQLNLNYPEKSVYFADQLRFLEKIMRNRALKDSHKP